MSDFELTGMETVLNELEKRLGEANMKRVVNKTLRRIAKDHLAPKVEEAAKSFIGETGNTVKQIAVGNVSWADYNIPHIKVGWKRSPGGESPRWNIEHLNEMGFSRNGIFYKPQGFGKLQGIIDEFGDEYPRLAKEGLEELVK
ncbi:TPA: hypothetical protein ACGO8M_001835 [Streptococcus suis]